MLAAERLEIVEKGRKSPAISRTPPPAHQIYPLSQRDGGYIFMCRGEMRTAAVVRSKSRAGTITREAFTAIEMRLFVKCWGADYKISQYNIFGYQNLSVSRSIKVYVF